MIIREISASDKKAFNEAAGHPLQSFEWGEFRQKSGVKVVRRGIFEGKKLVIPIQVTIHPIPKTNWNVGYFPKGPMPDEYQLGALKQIGRENQCLLVKLEPNIASAVTVDQPESHAFKTIAGFLQDKGCRLGRPLFTKYSFQLDLTKSEEEILKNMHHKTRYNIGLAKRRGVRVRLDDSKESFELFLKLLFEETLPRQGFYAHTPNYYQKLWSVLKPAGMVHLLRADYQKETLAMFMVFVFNQKIYYPYGASTRQHPELMAPNLLMWEVIRFGKEKNCQLLDMWGALGPKASKKDRWYGFHRFKKGYGGQLVEFLGSYDLVLKPKWYPIYRIVNDLRWKYLRIKAGVKKLG